MEEQKQSSKTLLVIALTTVGLLLLVGGIYFMTQDKNNSTNEELNTESEFANNDNNAKDIMVDSDYSKSDNENEIDENEFDSKSGEFVAYDASLLQRAETGNVVLFFHAGWCPTCRALELDINESLDDIESDLTILKTDYDSQTELKKKYGITVQHTLVQVDANGNLLKKWVGSPTLEKLQSELI